MKISLRTFAIVLLIISSVWLLARLAPPVYCWFAPPKDFQAVVEALENRGSAPVTAASAVQQTIASAGPLERALQIGYYYRAQVAIRVNEKHLEKESQASYIAWFPKLQRPILLILQKQQIDDGGEDYQIAQGDPTGLLRGFVVPLLAFIGAIVALRLSGAKRKARLKATPEEDSGSKPR
jgi:hypothetical protein